MELSFSFGLTIFAGFIGLIIILMFDIFVNKKIIYIITGLDIAVFLLAITASFVLIDKEWEYPDKPYATEYIVALNDSNMINGRTYVRSGRINEDLYYQYMTALRGGGYKANKVKSSNTTIYYDTNNYRVEWCERTKRWLWFSCIEKYNKIYIPEGSIINDFNIDLN